VSTVSTSVHDALAARILGWSGTPAGTTLPPMAETDVLALLDALEKGTVRAAERDAAGQWHAVAWVKRGILVGFRVGRIVDMAIGGHHGEPTFGFADKHLYPPRALGVADGVRVVPGGSAIRRGAYLAPGVVCMPPMYVNVGAYVGAGTMVDSHALVGSCAQIGERVHLSAAAQIGGVLETKAVLAAGVVLTRGTPVYDLVNERVIRGDAEHPLEIPPGAVVVPGARRVAQGWGSEQGISLQTPVIVKYRDERTDVATALESWLR
jgi:2,3,4,5-tetrahydropyridine-2-carboxylate N-succinyltransferase